MSTNWAAPLIGAPYKSGAAGPEAFDCVGLVRYYFRERHGLDLPEYSLGDPGEKLWGFVKATGWRPVSDEPAENDVVTMLGFEGPHVGVMVQCSLGLGLLHAQGNDRLGQVVWQPLNTLFGYTKVQCWRHS
jgi:hypothetical protein